MEDVLGVYARPYDPVRPVVVMDEGHKATPELAFKTLYGFNPCFVLELTAIMEDLNQSPKSFSFS